MSCSAGVVVGGKVREASVPDLQMQVTPLAERKLRHFCTSLQPRRSTFSRSTTSRGLGSNGEETDLVNKMIVSLLSAFNLSLPPQSTAPQPMTKLPLTHPKATTSPPEARLPPPPRPYSPRRRDC